MNLDIGAKRPIDGDQVFLVGRCSSTAEPPFVLLYDPIKARRAKRNLQKMNPTQIVEALGAENFVEVAAPHWGTVWFRRSKIREVRELPPSDLALSEVGFGSFVLFDHDPEPLDENSGFCLYGLTANQVSKLLSQSIQP